VANLASRTSLAAGGRTGCSAFDHDGVLSIRLPVLGVPRLLGDSLITRAWPGSKVVLSMARSVNSTVIEPRPWEVCWLDTAVVDSTDGDDQSCASAPAVATDGSEVPVQL
jgi:hypothetical protein